MTLRKAYKYRIYPSKSQITNLENQFSMCRHLYNWSLQERKEAYEKEAKSLTYRAQQNTLPKLKQERPWFKSVHSQVLQDALHRLDKAYKAFFRRVKSGETPGFPKFKKRGQWSSLTYPQYSKRPSKQITVPKVGDIRLVLHRQVPQEAKIKTLTITKDGGKWFACFSVELPGPTPELKQGLPAIGIDLGLIDFLYASDGHHVGAPKYFRKLQNKLARLQRRLSRATKRSERWYKLLRSVQKVHYQIRYQRLDFLHKTANDLLSRADVVIHEDLNIQKMSARPKPIEDGEGQWIPNGATIKAGINKSISDAGWYQFLLILKYKALELGKQVVAVPARYTSQKCPECGEIVKKSLSVRTHLCPSCGYTANRDFAAARNILSVGLDTLALKPRCPVFQCRE